MRDPPDTCEVLLPQQVWRNRPMWSKEWAMADMGMCHSNPFRERTHWPAAKSVVSRLSMAFSTFRALCSFWDETTFFLGYPFSQWMNKVRDSRWTMVNDWASMWYKGLAISVQWRTSLMVHIYSQDPIEQVKILLGLYHGPMAPPDLSCFSTLSFHRFYSPRNLLPREPNL